MFVGFVFLFAIFGLPKMKVPDKTVSVEREPENDMVFDNFD